MTATDELRRLLDERGVEYTFIPGDEYSREHIKIGSTEIWTNGRDEVAVYFLTPEQAIEATLGRGECELPTTRIDHGHIEYNGVTEWRKCSGCGREILAYPANYCPNCGRKVVDA